MKRHLVIMVKLLVLVVLFSSLGCQGPAPENNGRDKAAIIDQLYIREPNPQFITEASRILESYGFVVDLWQGIDVTVDFYRELPALGYELIIFRVHSGLLLALEGEEVIPLEKTYLFTAENYTTTRHVTDQLTDKVSNALMTDDYPLIFAVNSDFIREADGEFNGTVIVTMGCEGYYYDDMPAAYKRSNVGGEWEDLGPLKLTIM